MWARLNNDDNIAQLYTRPIGITLDGVQYPASIFSLWTAPELRALNIWSITMTNSPENQAWYNVSTPAYAVTKDDDDNVTGVTGTYTSTEKPLKDVYAIPVSNSDGFVPDQKVASSSTYSSAAKQGKVISKSDGFVDVEITKGSWSNSNTLRAFNSDGSTLSPAVSTTVAGTPEVRTRGKQWEAIQQIKDIQGSKLVPYDWYIVRKADAGTAIPSDVQAYRDAVRTKAGEHESAISATTILSDLRDLDTSSWPDEPSV